LHLQFAAAAGPGYVPKLSIAVTHSLFIFHCFEQIRRSSSARPAARGRSPARSARLAAATWWSSRTPPRTSRSRSSCSLSATTAPAEARTRGSEATNVQAARALGWTAHPGTPRRGSNPTRTRSPGFIFTRLESGAPTRFPARQSGCVNGKVRVELTLSLLGGLVLVLTCFAIFTFTRDVRLCGMRRSVVIIRLSVHLPLALSPSILSVHA